MLFICVISLHDTLCVGWHNVGSEQILDSINNNATTLTQNFCFWNLYLVQLIEHTILRIPNFCLFTFWGFFQNKSFNQYKNTPKNVNMTHYIKKKNHSLCNTLNWGNWNSGFVILGVRWAERDIRSVTAKKCCI